MQNTLELSTPKRGVLEQIMADLEVRSSAELAAMQAEGDRLVAEAISQQKPVAILHRRVGNREKLETFFRHSVAIQEIPAVRHCFMQTKVGEDFVGELELRVTENSLDAEALFRDAVSAAAPFFADIATVPEEGYTAIRATAELFELVAYTESFGVKE